MRSPRQAKMLPSSGRVPRKLGTIHIHALPIRKSGDLDILSKGFKREGSTSVADPPSSYSSHHARTRGRTSRSRSCISPCNSGLDRLARSFLTPRSRAKRRVLRPRTRPRANPVAPSGLGGRCLGRILDLGEPLNECERDREARRLHPRRRGGVASWEPLGGCPARCGFSAAVPV